MYLLQKDLAIEDFIERWKWNYWAELDYFNDLLIITLLMNLLYLSSSIISNLLTKYLIVFCPFFDHIIIIKHCKGLQLL